ncbi:hypothetical protein BGY98DRAFT_695987 [Russula aff. rugulosa BPL654]|nr:hypothetical protein BGY98DRAFT_695987 [Russula aff. rugulosa BPL654]
MLIFVFIWALSYSWEIAAARFGFRFPIHHGNLGCYLERLPGVSPVHGAVQYPNVLSESPMMLYNASEPWHKTSLRSPFHSQKQSTAK